MKVEDLRDKMFQQEDMGLTQIVLKVPKKSPPKGNRCSLLPGLNGVCCQYDGKHAVVMVEIAALRRWLERRGVDMQRPPI